MWEVSTGRCYKQWDLKAPVSCVAWNPNAALGIIAVSVGNDVVILELALGNRDMETTPLAEVLAKAREIKNKAAAKADPKKKLVDWVDASESESQTGIVLRIRHGKPLTQISWHYKGDYIVTVAPTANTKAILIHQFSKIAIATT